MVWREIKLARAGTWAFFHAAFPAGSLSAMGVKHMDIHRIMHESQKYGLAFVILGVPHESVMIERWSSMYGMDCRLDKYG